MNGIEKLIIYSNIHGGSVKNDKYSINAVLKKLKMTSFNDYYRDLQ